MSTGREISRRSFLEAGGATLAGLLLRGPAGPGLGAASRRPVVIRMRSGDGGAWVGFDPVGVRVPPGATIRWVVEAGAHSTTAYHPENDGHALRIPLGAVPWDSGILFRPGQSFETVLDRPGVYDYYCTPHERAGMAGRLVVSPAGGRAGDLSAPGPAAPGLDPPSAAALRALPPVAQILAGGAIPLGDPERSEA